jgi:hypothetical protein
MEVLSNTYFFRQQGLFLCWYCIFLMTCRGVALFSFGKTILSGATFRWTVDQCQLTLNESEFVLFSRNILASLLFELKCREAIGMW